MILKSSDSNTISWFLCLSPTLTHSLISWRRFCSRATPAETASKAAWTQWVEVCLYDKVILKRQHCKYIMYIYIYKCIWSSIQQWDATLIVLPSLQFNLSDRNLRVVLQRVAVWHAWPLRLGIPRLAGLVRFWKVDPLKCKKCFQSDDCIDMTCSNVSPKIILCNSLFLWGKIGCWGCWNHRGSIERATLRNASERERERETWSYFEGFFWMDLEMISKKPKRRNYQHIFHIIYKWFMTGHLWLVAMLALKLHLRQSPLLVVCAPLAPPWVDNMIRYIRISYHIISYHIISYHIISYHIMDVSHFFYCILYRLKLYSPTTCSFVATVSKRRDSKTVSGCSWDCRGCSCGASSGDSSVWQSGCGHGFLEAEQIQLMISHG